MIYTIFNDKLSVRVDSMGAQLRSLLSAGGTEYLWQGDARYWADSSPVLFPYIARLYNKSYTYCGERFSMDIHGFAAQCEFQLEELSASSVTLRLSESGETLRRYPFRFELRVSYSLSGSSLCVKYRVNNTDSRLMPFAIGGHPGFNVPFAAMTEFDDYYLRFEEVCSPVRVGFSDELFLSGEDEAYPLEDGNIMRLSHGMFDDDAIILSGTSKRVTLGCDGTDKSLTISFPGFDYFGIWHMPHTDAPYICLEPWTSLPSRQGVVEELTQKGDMIMLAAGEECEKQWTLSISEG